MANALRDNVGSLQNMASGTWPTQLVSTSPQPLDMQNYDNTSKSRIVRSVLELRTDA